MKLLEKIIKKINYLNIFLLLVSLILIYRITFYQNSGLENLFANISHPFLIVGNKVSNTIKNIFSKNKTLENILIENNLLRQANEMLLYENTELKSSINYQDRGQEILDFKKRYSLNNFIYADIIFKKISNAEHYFIINKGTLHGIANNMIATYKYQVIGRVTQTSRWHSKITLITDKKSKISAYANKSGATGIVQGKNIINKLDFNFVSHLTQIDLGDFIISSGKGLIYPEGYLLGSIINFEKQDLYYKIELEPLIDLAQLQSCLITSQETINANLNNNEINNTNTQDNKQDLSILNLEKAQATKTTLTKPAIQEPNKNIKNIKENNLPKINIKQETSFKPKPEINMLEKTIKKQDEPVQPEQTTEITPEESPEEIIEPELTLEQEFDTPEEMPEYKIEEQDVARENLLQEQETQDITLDAIDQVQ
ncbi:MAG: Cell shape-determining protein MreC [candidate division TM6 bacterium GW2011_GWF2_28_16]|nr:MAG: Cell shape-determining protein MreC [candidate division TM6 bacterium GW2011_GWF2_28_16]